MANFSVVTISLCSDLMEGEAPYLSCYFQLDNPFQTCEGVVYHE